MNGPFAHPDELGAVVSTTQARTAEALERDAGDEDALVALEHAMVKWVVIAVPLMVLFWIAVVGVGVGGRTANLLPWLGMASAVGVLAGLFFGIWAAFVVTARDFDARDTR